MSRTLFLGGVLTLLTALPAFAQYSQLAATDDGKQLYFISRQILKGKERGRVEYRLYRAGPNGVTLFAERGDLVPEVLSSQDGTLYPSISGDGSLVAFTMAGVCADLDCSRYDYRAMIRGTQSVDLGSGTVVMSRNGKWATLATAQSSDGPPVPWTTTKILINLTTGAEVKMFSVADNNENMQMMNSLASDGSAFVFVPNPPDSQGNVSGTFALWKEGELSPLLLPSDFSGYQAFLSDDASTLVAHTYGSQTLSVTAGLSTIDLRTGTRRTIRPNSDTTHFTIAGVSNNGQRVLYLACEGYTLDGPAFVWDAATGASIRAPLEPGELGIDGTLSGVVELRLSRRIVLES